MSRMVKQEHTFGCGVACVGYALGLRYRDALTLFVKPDYAWKKGYYCRDLISALGKAGVEYQHFYFRPKHKRFLSVPGVIVYTRSPSYPAGHYLVRTPRGLWMNPWANYPSIAPVRAAYQKILTDPIGYILIPAQKLDEGTCDRSAW